MKPLELSEEQKNRLLEMSEKLFPEYGEPQYLLSYMSKDEDLTGSPYIRWYDNRSGKMILVEIHWFEFCWQILRKILETEPARIRAANIIEIFGLVCFNQFESLHPVDYLYQEFK